jgi:hypothetical protein
MSQRAAEDRRVNAYTPVHCQRFFMQGGHATFVVIPRGEPELCQLQQQAETPDNDLAHTVLQDLATLEHRESQHNKTVPLIVSTKEVSPWLQMTRWPAYLIGRDLRATAALILQPEPGSDIVLHVLCQSLERLIDDAYQSVCSDAIGVFDQIRINTFL